jgi:hypothetical protein
MEVLLNDRLEMLKRDFEKGRQRMEALDRQRLELRDTMLRISGAIQVLEELAAVPRTTSEELEFTST